MGESSETISSPVMGKDITPVQQMVASCTGAILTSMLVTPLDVVKIRLQSQQKPPPKGTCLLYYNGLMDHICPVHGNGNGNGNGTNGRSGIQPSTRAIFFRNASGGMSHAECICPPGGDTIKSTTATISRNWYHRPGHFSGTLDAFVKIARYEGKASLWSGLPPTIVMAVPATVVYFTAYDWLKYRIGYRENDPSTRFVPVLAGSTARIGAATLITPLEMVRTKMQSEKLSYSQVGVALRHSIQEGGLRSLMLGLGPTLLRDLPFSAMYWFGYEYFKVQFMKQSHSQQPSFLQAFAAGALSGTIAGVVTLPFDVVKTHRQIELGKKIINKNAECQTTWCIIKKLYRQRGVRALFAGLAPRIIKVAPACAIMISSYEYGKLFFKSYNETHRDR